MKNKLTMKLKLATAMLLMTLSTMATNEKVDSTQTTSRPSEATTKLARNEIVSLLQNPSSELLALTERQATVIFTTDAQGHLVVIAVEASHPALQSFVTKQLRNKTLQSGAAMAGQKMQMTIQFK